MFSVEVFVNRILATRGCKADEPEQLTVPLGDNILVPFIKGVAEQTPLVFGMLPQLPRIDFVSRSINALPVARAGQSHTDLRSRRNPLFNHRWENYLRCLCCAQTLRVRWITTVKSPSTARFRLKRRLEFPSLESLARNTGESGEWVEVPAA